MKRFVRPKMVGYGLLMAATMLLLVGSRVGGGTADERTQINPEDARTPSTASASVAQKREKPAGAPQGSAAQRVYIDPQTGRFGRPPAAVRAAEAPELLFAFSTSHEGLIETPSPVLGGGVMVDLQGRFRSPLIATVDGDGGITIEHPPSAPGSDGKE